MKHFEDMTPEERRAAVEQLVDAIPDDMLDRALYLVRAANLRAAFERAHLAGARLSLVSVLRQRSRGLS